MKRSHLLQMMIVAAGTAGLILAVGLPTAVTAVDGSANPATIAQPLLKLAGGTVALHWDRDSYTPGDKPVIELEARNTGDQPIDETVMLSMSTLSPSNPMSRMPMRPVSLWKGECRIHLEPGQTRTFSVAIATAVPANVAAQLTAGVEQQATVTLAVPVRQDLAVNQVAAGNR